MYHDIYQSSEARTTDEAQESGEFNSERKNPLCPALCRSGVLSRRRGPARYGRSVA